MTRLKTVGFEVAFTSATGVGPDDFSVAPSTGLTQDTTVARSGTACAKFDSTGSNLAVTMIFLGVFQASTTYYTRMYVRLAALPTTSARIFGNTGAAIFGVRITSTGKLQLWNEVATAAQIGSDSVATLVTGTYYRVETRVVVNGSSQITDIELRLDGVTVAVTSGLTLSTNKVSWYYGWLTAPGASTVMFVDDLALNTGAGAVNNSWCGDGKVVLLKPTADSAVGTGWTLGTGTAISGNTGKTAVANTPPLGVADLAVGSDVKQIRNATSNANVNYDATMTTYTAAGVPVGAAINAIHHWIATGAPLVTSAKAGTVGIVSNPAVTSVALGSQGTAGAFWEGNAAATWPTGWKWSQGTLSEAPAVTLGTAPVMRVQQVTASTRIAMVCSMLMYVDYTPAAAPIPDVGMALIIT